MSFEIVEVQYPSSIAMVEVQYPSSIATVEVNAGTTMHLGGAGVWGAIGGTLANQTDLQAALNGKAGAAHTHTSTAITDFNAAVNTIIVATQIDGSYF
jgi:hypothetical protein